MIILICVAFDQFLVLTKEVVAKHHPWPRSYVALPVAEKKTKDISANSFRSNLLSQYSISIFIVIFRHLKAKYSHQLSSSHTSRRSDAFSFKNAAELSAACRHLGAQIEPTLSHVLILLIVKMASSNSHHELIL